MNKVMDNGITTDVASFIANTTFNDIPIAAVRTIKNAFIDTIGVAFAGRNEEGVKILFDHVKQEGGNAVATVWGKSDLRSSATLTALANGTMAHALDFDDLNAKATHSHPSASLVPAIFAVAEEVRSSGKDVILAYYIGFEVMAYIGRIVTYKHYKVGWHGTATIGVLGCVAAVASLYKLSVEQIQHAIGLAVSHISGTRQNFGTMTKPYHAGKAAHSGITAAKLAQKGFTANQTALEASMGFFNLYVPKFIPTITEHIGERIELLDTKLTLKKYPCCYGSHRAIDGILNLIHRYHLTSEQISSIVVSGPVNAFTPLIHTRPQTGLEAKFSLEFPIAKLLKDGELKISSFKDHVVQDPLIQNLMTKIERFEDESIQIESSAIDEGYILVAVTLQNGSVLEEKVYDPKGSVANPLSTEEIIRKFISCIEETFSATEAKQFVYELMQLETLPNLDTIKLFL